MFNKFRFLSLITALLILVMAGCGNTETVHQAAGKTTTAENPVLIEGAMPIEVKNFAQKLEDVEKEEMGQFVFYKGTIDDYPVIVAKTGKGMENAAAATAVAIEKYDPAAIINEGTAGGHDPKLHVGDIVLGKRTVNIGSFKTEIRKKGEGVDPSQWKPMDLMASEGSGSSADAQKIRYYMGDKKLLAAANAVKNQYTDGKVVQGTIGSADVWNNEVDRINYFHEKYGTSAEEMEGFAEAQIADEYNVPFLDIRVLSDNITNGGAYNPKTAGPCQDYVEKVVKKYISNMKAD